MHGNELICLTMKREVFNYWWRGFTFLCLVLSSLQASEAPDREIWWRLRSIQAQHASELAVIAENISGDSENGQQISLKLRHPVKTYLSLFAGLQTNFFQFDDINTHDSEMMSVIHTGLMLHRRDESLYLGLEADDGRNFGIEFEWSKPIRSLALIAMNLSRKNEQNSYLSIKNYEVIDELKVLGGLNPPSPFFCSVQGRVFQSTLMSGEHARGTGDQLILFTGLHFERRPDRKVGWQFYNSELKGSDSVGEYFEIIVSQSFETFSAGDAYNLKIGRSVRSTPFSIGSVFSHSLNSELGLRLAVNVGSDAARELKFSKVLFFNGLLNYTLNNQQQILLNFSHSTENTGAISGDISRISLGFHWNL